jgi:hypothetical protein
MIKNFTTRDLQELLLENGYDNYYSKNKIEHGIYIHSNYFLKGDVCIKFLSFNKKLRSISIHNEWDKYNVCGKCLYYDISINDVVKYVNGEYKPVERVVNNDDDSELVF